MKIKKSIILSSVIVISSLANAALNWEYGGDTLGTGYTAGWLVIMYNDVNNDTTLSSLIVYDNGSLSSSDDVSASISTSVVESSGDYFWQLYGITTPGQFYAYSVVFNAASFAEATQYIVIDSAPVLLPDTSGMLIGTYSIASNSGTWKDIQAVPEPATFLLFGMGGIGAWLVRRKNRMSV